jgi:hypothetical protein
VRAGVLGDVQPQPGQYGRRFACDGVPVEAEGAWLGVEPFGGVGGARAALGGGDEAQDLGAQLWPVWQFLEAVPAPPGDEAEDEAVAPVQVGEREGGGEQFVRQGLPYPVEEVGATRSCVFL